MRTLIALAAVISCSLLAARADESTPNRPAARSASERSPALSRNPKRAPDETDITGGGNDPTFRDVAPKGGLLIGFQMGYGRFVNKQTVISIRPIYLTPAGERSGRLWGVDDRRQGSIHAKRGYAVGALTVHQSLPVYGIKVTFMRIKKDGTLDVNDAYDSDWFGTAGGDGSRRLGGDGSLVVGICGKANRKDITGLGLILATKDTNQADAGDK